MRKLKFEKREPNHFVQGIFWGLAFGTLGAIIILGRDRSVMQTLDSGPAPVIEVEVIEPALPPAADPPTPIAQG